MFIPYEYQVECLEALRSARHDGAKKGLIVMASGLGKTVTVALDVRRWREEHPGRVLYLCHQNDILYQAKTTFQAVLGNDRTYGFYHGEEKDLHSVDCLFASFQTMLQSVDLFNPDEFAYIVIDESHHTSAKTYLSVVNYFKPSFLFGVTATPDRMDQQNIREIYGKELYFLPLDEAMARGLVTPVDYRLMSDEISLESISSEANAKLSIGYLNRTIFVPKRDEEIARIIASHAGEFVQPRIIIFCASINHCNHLTQFIPDSFALHSKIPSRERAVRLEMFRQGIVSTILTVDAFNEGVDIPQANLIVFLRSTESATIFLQQLGRGLRRSEGKDKVTVLDFVGNCERIKMVYNLRDAVEERFRQLQEEFGPRDTIAPMTLNADHPGFAEKIVQIQEILERLRPKLITDMPQLLWEYSKKNLLPPERVIAGTNKKLRWVGAKCGHEWQSSGASRVNGSGCPFCNWRAVNADNNLATLYPDIAVEYSEKNELAADLVRAGSHKKVWWRCRVCQHEWRTQIQNRTGRGDGCPSCAGRIATQENNLTVTHPDLAEEYSKKNEIPVNQIKAGTSSRRVWWRCKKCQHEWQAHPSNRSRGVGCPACAGRVPTKQNSIEAHPPLLQEYSAKNPLPASQVIAGTPKKLWWECATCGHEWQATGASRSRQGSGCPSCYKERVSKKKEKNAPNQAFVH